jgi:hypothetical protein
LSVYLNWRGHFSRAAYIISYFCPLGKRAEAFLFRLFFFCAQNTQKEQGFFPVLAKNRLNFCAAESILFSGAFARGRAGLGLRPELPGAELQRFAALSFRSGKCYGKRRKLGGVAEGDALCI